MENHKSSKWDLIGEVIDLDCMRGSSLDESENYGRVLEKISVPLGVSIWDFDSKIEDKRFERSTEYVARSLLPGREDSKL